MTRSCRREPKIFNTMNKLMLLADASVNTSLGYGYGAYLVVSSIGDDFASLAPAIKVKRFTNTSSTKLELQTILWALSEIPRDAASVVVYSDSQNVLRLPDRRAQLEKNDFYSNRGTRLASYELYKEFYKTLDVMNCEFVAVMGHKASRLKNDVDRIFSLVDKASRKALRADSGLHRVPNASL